MDFFESSSFQLEKYPGGKWPPGPGNDKAGWDYHQLGESNRVHMAKDTKKWKVSFIMAFIAPNWTKIMTYACDFLLRSLLLSHQYLKQSNQKLDFKL